MNRVLLSICVVLVSMVTLLAQQPYQQYVSPDQVPVFTLDTKVANPTKPDGYRVANVEFQTSIDSFASSSMVLDADGKMVWRYTTPFVSAAGNEGSMFNHYRINDTMLTIYEFSPTGGHYYTFSGYDDANPMVWAMDSMERTRPHEFLVLTDSTGIYMGERWDSVRPAFIDQEMAPGDTIRAGSTMENIYLREVHLQTGAVIGELQSLDILDALTELDPAKTTSNRIKVCHWNSIDAFKWNGDQYLVVSGQASNTIYIINWTTKTLEHRIGGRLADITFLPPVYSPNDSLHLYGQHYAKITSWNETTQVLTLRVFNNRYDESAAEALTLKVNLQTLLVENISPSHYSNFYSPQIGSFDLFDGGSLVNWGRTGDSLNMSVYNEFGVKQMDGWFPRKCDTYRIQPVSESEMTQLNTVRPVINKAGCTLTTANEAYWQDGSGVLDTSFVVTEPGTYFVEVPYGFGLLRSEEVVINDTANACGQVGINDMRSEVFVVYPNPASSTLMIKHTNGVEVLVTDLVGSLKIAQPLNNGTVQLDVAKLPRGTYIVTVKSRTGLMINKKIVLQ